MQYCYVIISRTHTKFGSVLRRIGHIQYNHAAIALDPDLEFMYSFARRQHNALLVCGLVKENLARYTLYKSHFVDVVIFRIPLSDDQYTALKQEIAAIGSDKAYQYNLFSILLYPLFRGFHTYKAYTCIEFVMHTLERAGIHLEKPACKYRPDDLLQQFHDEIYYRGNLLDYAGGSLVDDTGYFDPITPQIVLQSGLTLAVLSIRLLRKTQRVLLRQLRSRLY